MFLARLRLILAARAQRGDHRYPSPVKLTLNVPMLFYIKRGILIY